MAISSRRDAPILFWATVALVVLLPLPLGAIYQWSWSLMALVMGIVLAFWSVRVAFGQQEATVGLRGVWWLLLPFALCILWIMLQSSAMTPEAWHHPLWQSTAEALQIDLDGAVSSTVAVPPAPGRSCWRSPMPAAPMRSMAFSST